MRDRLFKATWLFVMIILMFSLIGCSSSTESKDLSSQKVKSTEVKKDQEKKVSTVVDQSKDQAANTEATSQKDTTAAVNNPTTQAAPSVNATQTQTAPNVKASAPAVTAPPVQSKPTTSTGQTATTPPPAATTTKQVPVQTVRITIIGPKDKGTIINGKTVNIKEGDTVLSVLIEAVGRNNVDSSGSGATAYVAGIDNIYEFDYGPKSGWTCSQNGTRLSRSAGAIQVKAGDQIEWKYTEDYTVNK